ncbi:unnamed protein product [Clavelina lepadiformis]|uniref:WD repeat, SAM and U-box domain-containing protein 1 n=1 Tax=Clavelina lepadiformis TaxID=159417 RepID=A0ABP0H096_CLALP
MLSYQVIQNHTKEVNCCTFSEDYFATCSGDKTVRVYSTSNFQELPYSPINVFKYGVNFVVFNTTGSLLATACSDGKAHLFCLSDSDAQIVAVFRHTDVSTAQVCSFSNKSNYLVTGSADGSIALWDVEKKKQLREISGHSEGNVYAATFTPCDCYIVSGSGLGDIRVWNVKTMQAICAPIQAHAAGVSSCGVSCITFSPTFHSSLTSETRCFLMASSGHDNKVKLWIFSNETKSLRFLQELKGHDGPVSFCCFSSNGNHLASSSFDSSIIIWNPILCEQEMKLDGHGTIVTSVAYSKTNYLASTSYDKKVIIWKLNNGTEEQVVDDAVLYSSKAASEAPPPITMPDGTEELTQAQPSYQDWSCEQVASWLNDEVKLSQYADIFKENDIDGRELDGLAAEILQKDLGIASLGHRNKIMRAIKSLQSQAPLKGLDLRNLNLKDINLKALNLDPHAVAGVVQSLAAKNSSVATTTTQDFLNPSNTPVKVTDVRPANEGEVPDQYLCPISRDIMSNPVIAADGFTYERRMIEAWFLKGNVTSPLSNKQLTNKKLTPNQTLRSLIEEFREKRQSKVQEWVSFGGS